MVGTINLLETLRTRSLHRLVCVSSSGVYRDLSQRTDLADGMIDEELIGAPASLYAVSKFSAERIALRYAELFGLDVVIGRVAHVDHPVSFTFAIMESAKV